MSLLPKYDPRLYQVPKSWKTLEVCPACGIKGLESVGRATIQTSLRNKNEWVIERGCYWCDLTIIKSALTDEEKYKLPDYNEWLAKEELERYLKVRSFG